MLKSHKVRPAYLVFNFVGLRTFWMPLVLYVNKMLVDNNLPLVRQLAVKISALTGIIWTWTMHTWFTYPVRMTGRLSCLCTQREQTVSIRAQHRSRTRLEHANHTTNSCWQLQTSFVFTATERTKKQLLAEYIDDTNYYHLQYPTKHNNQWNKGHLKVDII